MQLAWVGFGAFFVVSLAVGIRLVALWLRTRQAPELLIGLGVLGIGPVGFGLQALAVLATDTSFGEALAATGACAVAVGIWAKLTFNWLVYRRRSRIALAFALGVGVAVAAHLLAQPLFGTFLGATRDPLLFAARGALQVVALGWGSAEAFLHWSRLRRRARLGLAEPVLVNRFWMWATAAGAAALGTAIGVTASLFTGVDALRSPALLASSSAHGFVAAVAMGLAFAPPRVYLAWLNARAARA